ncbi:MAG: GAF domain-containing sensor histidine kinase [Armatimonadota bacterium]
MPELERLLDAVHLATQKLASPGETKALLRDVLSICLEAVGAMGGTIYMHDPGTKTLRFLHVLPEEVERKLERLDLPDDYGVAGRVFQNGAAEVSEFGQTGDPHRNAIVRRTGVTVKNMITVPLMMKGSTPIGVVQLVNKREGPFDDTDEAVLDTISDVCTFAIMNTRLLEQQTRVASLEGMGRAAHDLANKAGVLMTFMPDMERNIEGLRKVLCEQGIKGEACLYLDLIEATFSDVLMPYSERVFRYAKLINDLAAGKPLTPKFKVQSFASVVQETCDMMEAQARPAHVELRCDLQKDAQPYLFDDLFIIRIVENLVGNAIKAVKETITPEWMSKNGDKFDSFFGTVLVRYRCVEGHHILEVVDEGKGLSPAQIRSILSGTARSRWESSEGTGLGTKVVLDLASTHGAKLAVRSRLGEGASFELDFPPDPTQTFSRNLN